MLENYVDVRDFGDHAHQDRNVRVPQDALHHDLVLNFLEQLICQTRVEYFLNCYWSSVEKAFVNY